MSLIFEPVYTDGLSQLSYLLGDTASGRAAVIDPRRDVDPYLRLVRERELTLTHVFDTHVHEDYVSGARELQAQSPSFPLYLSGHGEPGYAFEHQPVQAGDRFSFGGVELLARHTPGPTPEHLSFELIDSAQPDQPWGVLAGDALTLAADQLGDPAGKQASQLYHTLYDYYLQLANHVILYPCHSFGSAGHGRGIDRHESTIGYERKHNPLLAYPDDEAGFRSFIEGQRCEAPAYHHRLKTINRDGPEILHGLPPVRALSSAEMEAQATREDTVVVDTRDMLAFGGGHIPGAINIGNDPMLSAWAPRMLDPAERLLLVLPKPHDLDQVLRRLIRTGLTCIHGYLAGGMTAWSKAGKPLETVPQLSVEGLMHNADAFRIFDVRNADAYEKGHVPGAEHQGVCSLRAGDNGLQDADRGQPIATYCESGYQASLAASILQARGFEHIYSIPGSWSAWQKADFPIEA